MPRTAAYYDRVSAALNNLTQQLNVISDRDMQREQLGLKNLQDTQTMMMQLEQQKRAKESQEFQMEMARNQDERAAAAEGRAVQQWALSIPGLTFNNLRFENAMDESDVNVSKWFNKHSYVANEVRNNPQLQQDIASVFGEGTTFDPNTFKVMKNGRPLRMAGWEQSNKSLSLIGIAESYLDPSRSIEYISSELNNKLSELEKTYSNLNPKDMSNKAAIAGEIAQTKIALNKTVGQLNPIKLLSFYRLKDHWLRTAANIAESNMASPASINLLSNAMAQNSRVMESLQEQIMKNSKEDKLQGIHKQAVLLDDQGNIVKGSARWALVPKESGSFSPGEVDPRMEGNWVWKEEYDASQKGKSDGSGSPVEFKIENAISQKFGKQDIKGQWLVTPENQGMAGNASRKANELLNKYPDANKMDLVNIAEDWARGIEGKTKDILSKLIQDHKEGKITKEQATKALTILIKNFQETTLYPYDPISKDNRSYINRYITDIGQ